MARSDGAEVSGRKADLPHLFAFVEDLSEYEQEEREESRTEKGTKHGTMAKAVVFHGVPTNWRINGVADCAGRIMGEVTGARWLLGEKRKEGKTASSVVVYPQKV